MSEITMNVSQRKKKKLILQLLDLLKSSGELDYPIHRMEAKELFDLFQKMNGGFDDVIFSDIKIFTFQMNKVIDQCHLSYITTETSQRPYKRIFTIDTRAMIFETDSMLLNESYGMSHFALSSIISFIITT